MSRRWTMPVTDDAESRIVDGRPVEAELVSASTMAEGALLYLDSLAARCTRGKERDYFWQLVAAKVAKKQEDH